MTRSSLAAAAAIAVATVSLGVCAPAAVAVPSLSHHHGRPSGHPHGATSQDARRLQIEQKRIAREIHRKDNALSHVLKFKGFTLLGDADAAAVSTNVTSDRTTLATLDQQVAASTTMSEARALAGQVHVFRPSVYHVIINDLRRATRIQSLLTADETTLSELAAKADALETQGLDVTGVRTALVAATVAAQDIDANATSATEAARTLSATSSHAVLHAINRYLAAASDALDTVDAQLQAAQDALTALAGPVT